MLRVATCWDDGVVDDIRLVALCRRYHVPATFNLGAGLFQHERTVYWHDRGKPVARLARDEVRVVYEGFDVANHGYLHQRLTEISPDAQLVEVMVGRAELEALLGREVLGYCYAYGANDATAREAVRAAGHLYGRTVEDSDAVVPPADAMQLDPSRHFLADDFWEEYERQRALGGVFYFWGHSYELRDEADWADVEDIFARISSDPNAGWCRVVDLLGGAPHREGEVDVDELVADLRALGPYVDYDVVPHRLTAAVADAERRGGPAAANQLLHQVRSAACATRPEHPGVKVPDAMLAELDAELARIRDDTEPPSGLDEIALRDLAYGLGRMLPVGLTDIEVRASPPGEVCEAPCIQWHMSVRRAGMFGRAAWWDAYERMAECAAGNQQIGGAFASSWFYDPELERVTPHLAHLRADLEAAGAELHELPTDALTTELALMTSTRRRALYANGEYVPRKYLVFWPRDRLIQAKRPADLR
jgi:hypothetical protein